MIRTAALAIMRAAQAAWMFVASRCLCVAREEVNAYGRVALDMEVEQHLRALLVKTGAA